MIPSSVRKEEWLLRTVCYTVLKHFIIVLSDLARYILLMKHERKRSESLIFSFERRTSESGVMVGTILVIEVLLLHLSICCLDVLHQRFHSTAELK